MSLNSALFSSVAGLDAASTAISVIGDNIANVNTPGYKERRAEFSDVLGQSITGVNGTSSLGQGTRLSKVATLYTQGPLEATSRAEDLAIDGQGFFVLDSPDGTLYTRSGIFGFDDQGVYTDSAGNAVQGFAIDPLTGQVSGALSPITRSTALAPPQESTSIDLSLNLDPSDTIYPGFDPAAPAATAESSTSVTLYDSLGNQHQSTIYFTQTATGTWEWNATLDQADTTLPPVAGATDVVMGSGTLTFDTDGVLTGVTGTSVTFEFSGGVTAGQVIDLDFGPVAGVGTGTATTAFARETSVNSISQDGFSAGTLTSTSIGEDGVLTGLFSNGETIPLAQLALATFPNIDGLQAIGGSNVIETRDSGQPLIGQPGTSSFGSIKSANLEQSTVDLAAQFVRLIINQRAFQANTRTISTTNELLSNLVSLGQ